MLLDIVWKSFLVSLAGGVLSLDRTAAFQVMVSRPIVVGPVVGYLLGDAATGLLAGGLLELFFIGGLPIGGYIPPHEAAVTVIVTAVAIIGQTSLNMPGFFFPNPAGLGFAVLIVLPVNIVCEKMDIAVRNYNTRFFYSASSDLEQEMAQSVVWNNLKGAGVFFALNFFTMFFATIALAALESALLPFFPKAVIMSFFWTFDIVFIVGIASAYNAVYDKRSLPLFLAAAFVAVAGIAVIIR